MYSVHSHLRKTFNRDYDRPCLVLHIHDELLYEVPSKQFKKAAEIIKTTMESAVHLSVPFPVKLKTGMSWGEMEEFEI